MLISREVDYAARIVLLLADTRKKMDAREISEISEVSLRFTLKILGKLSTAGIVNSFRGARGGYIIARESKDISMYDIIEALEGGVKVNGCFEGKASCTNSRMTTCKMRASLEQLQNKIKKELQEVTMDTLSCNS